MDSVGRFIEGGSGGGRRCDGGSLLTEDRKLAGQSIYLRMNMLAILWVLDVRGS